MQAASSQSAHVEANDNLHLCRPRNVKLFFEPLLFSSLCGIASLDASYTAVECVGRIIQPLSSAGIHYTLKAQQWPSHLWQHLPGPVSWHQITTTLNACCMRVLEIYHIHSYTHCTKSLIWGDLKRWTYCKWTSYNSLCVCMSMMIPLWYPKFVAWPLGSTAAIAPS